MLYIEGDATSILEPGLLSLDHLSPPLLPILHAPLVDLGLAVAQALEKLKTLHRPPAKSETVVCIN